MRPCTRCISSTRRAIRNATTLPSKSPARTIAVIGSRAERERGRAGFGEAMRARGQRAGAARGSDGDGAAGGYSGGLGVRASCRRAPRAGHRRVRHRALPRAPRPTAGHGYNPRMEPICGWMALSLCAAAAAQPRWVRVPIVANGEHAMVYDAARQRVVLFSGSLYESSGETWEWDGASWLRREPATKPPGRTLHALAYD